MTTGRGPEGGDGTGAGGGGLIAAASAIVADATLRDPWLSQARIAGIGWATVELERAAEELTLAFRRAGMAEPAWLPGPRDGLLGASTWVSREWWPAPDGAEGPAIVLLEADTEGRLAAALARFDEGVAAVYLETSIGTADRSRLGGPSAGPLGAARLLLARPTWGPHVLILDGPVP
jgi:hypothetical protein